MAPPLEALWLPQVAGCENGASGILNKRRPLQFDQYGWSQVSDVIRGLQGSVVNFFVRKRTGQNTVVQLTRQRVPGGKTEVN